MPQVFQVLRCYKCLVFQVHQTKKSNKFQCKMCGEKQSIKRHYGLGNGKECRKHVQRLNEMRGEMDESKSSQSINTDDEDENDSITPEVKTSNPYHNKSKWSDYLEEKAEPANEDDDRMYLNDTEVVLEVPKKRRKAFGQSLKKNPNTETSSDIGQPDEDYQSSSVTNQSFSFSRVDGGSKQIGNVSKTTICITPIKEEKKESSDFAVPHSSEGLDNVLMHLNQTESVEIASVPIKIKFVPPAVNKNSKWAKFTEDEQENDTEKSTTSQCNSQIDPHALFSLCDDTDLDAYLTL